MHDPDVHQLVVDRIPADLSPGGDPEIVIDKDEILILCLLDPTDLPDGDGRAHERAAEERIDGFRSETRGIRVEAARAIERRTGRKVSWGARCGDVGRYFTHLSVPVMSRLNIRERELLDTLVAAGVARSRSDAVAWCVKRVRTDQREWLDELRTAFEAVAKVRDQGPDRG